MKPAGPRPWARTWLPLILWAGLIFLLSSYQYPEKTAIVTGLEQQVDSIDIPSISIRPLLPQQTLTDAINKASDNEAARRLVHAILYLVLGLLTMRAVVPTFTRLQHPGWVSWAACTLYGVTDEIHQIFIPGRTFQLLDIAVDSIGVLSGIFIYLSFIKPRTQPKAAHD